MPKDVAFSGSCFPERALKVTGSVDYVFATLVRIGRTDSVFTLGRMPKREGGDTFSSFCGNGNVLPAGDYRLVVLHGAGPATLTVTFPGLTGRLSIQTSKTRMLTSLVDLPPVRDYSPTASYVNSYGTERPLAGRGLIAVAGWVHQDSTSAVTTMGDCEFPRSATDPLPDALAFLPGCPTGSSSNTLPGPNGPGIQSFGSTYSNIAANRWATGYYYIGAAPSTNAGALAAWIPFGA